MHAFTEPPAMAHAPRPPSQPPLLSSAPLTCRLPPPPTHTHRPRVPAEAAICRKTASTPMLRVVNEGQPRGYWAGATVAPMHTSMSFWQGGLGLSAAKLAFPCHMYYLASSKLCKYGLVTKAAGAFVSLPEVRGVFVLGRMRAGYGDGWSPQLPAHLSVHQPEVDVRLWVCCRRAALRCTAPRAGSLL